MKNKEFQKLLKKNKLNSNSGFTLTELLVGLFMSIFVIGALGFGLMQVLRLTQKGNSETLVRNDLARASEFITDEMRRAQAIEVDMGSTNIAAVAPNFSLPTGGTVRLALDLPNVDERVIYSVAPAQSPWQGPLVIYRWGPNFDANGDYTDPTTVAGWQNQALVDGVSDVNQTIACDNNGDGTDETITYQGFFACVVDDDGDTILDAAGNPIKENITDANGDGEISFKDDPNDRNDDGIYNFGDTLTDTNGDGNITLADSALDINQDGKIDAEDAADVDGLAITAQLYFSGETLKADGINTDTYSADTKAVVRSRTAPDNNSGDFDAYITSFESLNPSFSCKGGNPKVDWSMRTDFGNPSDYSQTTWDHKKNRQPQPIQIDDSVLVVSSIPRGVGADAECINSREGNGQGSSGIKDFSGNKTLGESEDWYGEDDVVAISHVIDLNDPRTFNGNPNCDGCDTDSDGLVYNHGETTPNQYVRMFKNGTIINTTDYPEYNVDGQGEIDVDSGDQISLGEFLSDPYGDGSVQYARPTGTDGEYEIVNLQSDERIIAFEIGKHDVSNPADNPGVDFQDNIFILRNDAFSQNYSTIPTTPPSNYSVVTN